MKQNTLGTEGPEVDRPPPKPMSKEDRAWLEAVMKGNCCKLSFLLYVIL
jgi:hypothetical protein